MSASLSVKTRDQIGKANLKDLREQMLVPGIVYGFETESINVLAQEQELKKVYQEAGENQVVSLEIEGGKTLDVIIKELQNHSYKDKILHADFYAINPNQEVVVPVPIHFTGVSQAVKVQGGQLIKKLDHLEVRCLPKDLIKFIEIDLSILENLEDHITVKAVDLPEGLTIENNLDDLIVTVKPPRVEAAPEATATTAEGEATEGSEEAKPEGEKKEEAAS